MDSEDPSFSVNKQTGYIQRRTLADSFVHLAAFLLIREATELINSAARWPHFVGLRGAATAP